MNTARLFLWRPADDSYLVIDGSDLPAIAVPPSARLPHLALRWCRQQHLRASFITTIGGVGRADGSVEWGAWLRLDGAADGYQRVTLEAVESRTTESITRRLVAAQRGIRRCVGSSRWLGMNPCWPEMVLAWIARKYRGQCVSPLVPIRADGTTIVARCTVDGRAVFFTTRANSFCDPELCDVLADHVPGVVPHTIAYDARRRWWLTADVGGCDAKTYIERTRGVAERLSDLTAAIADVQVATVGSREIQRLSFEVSLPSIRDGVVRAVNESGDSADVQSSVDRLWGTACASEAPLTWIHSDPSPDNIRVADNDRLLCIDMEDPWYGPAPLMGALALRSMSRRCEWTAEQSRAIGEPAWGHYIHRCGLAPERNQFEHWFRLAELAHLIRRIDRSARGPGRLLHEETPRRARAITSELHRLFAGL